MRIPGPYRRGIRAVSRHFACPSPASTAPTTTTGSLLQRPPRTTVSPASPRGDRRGALAAQPSRLLRRAHLLPQGRAPPATSRSSAAACRSARACRSSRGSCSTPTSAEAPVELAATDMELSVRAPLDRRRARAGPRRRCPAACCSTSCAACRPQPVVARARRRARARDARVRRQRVLAAHLRRRRLPAAARDRSRAARSPSTREAFLEAAERVVRAASSDESRPVLTGVLVELGSGTLTMAATDSYRMAVRTTPLEGGPPEDLTAIVPARALAELVRIAPRSTATSVEIVVEREPGAVRHRRRLALGARASRASSPSSAGCCPTRSSTRCCCRAPSSPRCSPAWSCWRSALAAAAALRAGRADGLGADPGGRRGPRALPCDFRGEPLEIGFNAGFLRDGVESSRRGRGAPQADQPLRPGLLTGGGDDFWYLVMPIRLSGLDRRACASSACGPPRSAATTRLEMRARRRGPAIVGPNGAGKTSLLEAVHFGCLGLVAAHQRRGARRRATARASRASRCAASLRGPRDRVARSASSRATPKRATVDGARRASLDALAEPLRDPGLHARPAGGREGRAGDCAARYFDRAVARSLAALRGGRRAPTPARCSSATSCCAASAPARAHDDALAPWDGAVAQLGRGVAACARRLVRRCSSRSRQHLAALGGERARSRCATSRTGPTTRPGSCAELAAPPRRATSSAAAPAAGPAPRRHRVRRRASATCAASARRASSARRVLALLLAEADLVHEVRGVRPLLLLDDVASELDRERARSACSRLLRGARPDDRHDDRHGHQLGDACDSRRSASTAAGRSRVMPG